MTAPLRLAELLALCGIGRKVAGLTLYPLPLVVGDTQD